MIAALTLLLLGLQTPEKDYLAALDSAAKAIVAANINEAAAQVDKAYAALESMGKPYKHAGHYKRVELRLRDLLRRADTLVKDTPIDDRPAAQAAYDRISAVHEKVLTGVMSKKE